MNRRFVSYRKLAVAGTLTALLCAPGLALAQNEDATLARGAQPDTTPQQRYQTAIREAGGGMKVGREACNAMEVAQRKACHAEVQARYKADMAQAREMLRNPDARPVDEVGSPIRMTETVTIIKP